MSPDTHPQSRPSPHRVTEFLAARQALVDQALQNHFGLRAAKGYADLVDEFVRDLFLAADFDRVAGIQGDDLAVMALGGYGRRRCCWCWPRANGDGVHSALKPIHRFTFRRGCAGCPARS